MKAKARVNAMRDAAVLSREQERIRKHGATIKASPPVYDPASVSSTSNISRLLRLPILQEGSDGGGMPMSDHSNRYQLLSLASRLRNMSDALTADELAKILHMSRLTILRRAKRGKIPSFRIGSAVRFDPAAISKWLLQQGVKSMRT